MGFDVIFDLFFGFKTFPPHTLPHFFNFVSFLFYVFPSHMIHLSLSSYYLVQYSILLRRDELLDMNRSGSNIPLLRTLLYSDHHIKTIDFFLVVRCEKALNFAFWSLFLVEKHGHILKNAKSILSSLNFCLSVSNSHLVCVLVLASLDTLRRSRAGLH